MTQEDKLGVYRASYRRFIYVKLLFVLRFLPLPTLMLRYATHTRLSDCWLLYAYHYSDTSWWPSPFMYEYLLSRDMPPLYLCCLPLVVLSTPMYISALFRALGTPSEFSSVPILVADELVQSSSCATPILGNSPTSNCLSPERLSHSCDLAIRMTTTRNNLRIYGSPGLCIGIHTRSKP